MTDPNPINDALLRIETLKATISRMAQCWQEDTDEIKELREYVESLEAKLEFYDWAFPRSIECWDVDRKYLDELAARPKKAAKSKSRKSREHYQEIAATYHEYLEATGGRIMAAKILTAQKHDVSHDTIDRARKAFGDSR